MINCPNCDKQIADDSAHCGYCGHQLEDKPKKKTMFGMAALGGDELKKAVEQAKNANKDEDDKDKAGGLKIPKPGQGGGKEGGERKGLKLPKPGQKQSGQEQPDQEQPDQEQPHQEQQQASGDAGGEDRDEAGDGVGMAKTERIDLSAAERPTGPDSEPQPSSQPDAEPPTEPHTVPSPRENFNKQNFNKQNSNEGPSPQGPDSESPSTVQASDTGDADREFKDGKNVSTGSDAYDHPPGPSIGEPAGPGIGEPAGPGPSQVSQAGAQTGPFGPGAKAAEEANQEHQPGVPDQNQPTPPAGGPPPQGPSPIAQQSDFGQQQVSASTPLEEQGSNKKMIIIGITIAALVLGGGCALGLAYWAYTAFF